MCGRFSRALLLLFLFAWFGVILPGHKRGQVTLPGARARCCASPAKASPCHSPATPQQPCSRACAICYFMAMLDVPPAVQCDVPPLGPSRIATVRPPAIPHLPLPRLPAQSRGPPATA